MARAAKILLVDDEVPIQRAIPPLLRVRGYDVDLAGVMTHRAILKAVGGANAVEQPEHLWVLMAQLRKKIEPDPSHPRYLLSEPWVGYRFVSARGTLSVQPERNWL